VDPVADPPLLRNSASATNLAVFMLCGAYLDERTSLQFTLTILSLSSRKSQKTHDCLLREHWVPSLLPLTTRMVTAQDTNPLPHGENNFRSKKVKLSP
jgi:hypothetical protein